MDFLSNYYSDHEVKDIDVTTVDSTSALPYDEKKVRDISEVTPLITC